MSGQALVIDQEVTVSTILAGALRKALKMDSVCVRNLHDAQEVLRRSGIDAFKLIVSDIGAPLDMDASRPVGRILPTAVDFLRGIRAGSDDPPCIFVVEAADGEYMEHLRDLRNVELLAVGSALDLPDVARKMLDQVPGKPKPMPRPLDVNIRLTGDLNVWELKNKERGIELTGTINIPPQELEDLLLDSSMVGAIVPGKPNLNAMLIRRLGLRLYNCLAGNTINSKLGESISGLTNCLALLESTRLRFELNARTSGLVVEVLARPTGDGQDAAEDLWMLKLPIFRKYGNLGGRPPLFKDQASRDGPVKCLLIEGETRSFSSSGAVAKRFDPLRHVDEEIKWLAVHLARYQERCHLAPPKVLRAANYEAGEFGAVVRRTLAEEPWQLIHYSGHSEMGTDNKPYLVLGAMEEDLLDLDTFARCAPHAQFVFLNSCRSAESSFILRLVERNIPAVAGYAWHVPDRLADRFSREFYMNLFPEDETGAQRFLEYAFMRAKAGLYKANSQDPMWTAPLLFMQTLDSQEAGRRPAAAGVMQ